MGLFEEVGMKKVNRKKCAGFIAVIFLIMSLSACGAKTSMEAEFNEGTGGYEVVAENAKDAVCIGSITVSDGECLAVSPNLDKGRMIITVYSAEDFEAAAGDESLEALTEIPGGAEKHAALRETITGNDVSVYPLDPGDYYISFAAEDESTSGTLKAMPFSIEELREQDAELADTLGGEDSAADTAVSSEAAGTAVTSADSGSGTAAAAEASPEDEESTGEDADYE